MSVWNLAPDQYIDISAFANYPAGPTPPGVKPDFVHPPKDQLPILIIGSTLVVLMLVFVSCRAYHRLRILHHVGWDDLCLLLGVSFTLLSQIAASMAVTWGVVGIDIWNVKVGQIAAEPTALSSALVEISGSWAPLFVKGALFLLFWSVFGQRRWLRITLLIGGTLSTLISLGCALVVTAFAMPKPGESFLRYSASGRAQFGLRLAIPISGIAVSTDVLMLLIPLIAVWNLKMSFKKKVAVIAVFAAAFLAIVASTASLYFRIQLVKTANYTGYLAPIFVCGVAEYTLGICCACAPAVSHVVRVTSPLTRLRSRISSLAQHFVHAPTAWTASTISATTDLPREAPPRRPGAAHLSPGAVARVFRSLGSVVPAALHRRDHDMWDSKAMPQKSTLASISTGIGTMSNTMQSNHAIGTPQGPITDEASSLEISRDGFAPFHFKSPPEYGSAKTATLNSVVSGGSSLPTASRAAPSLRLSSSVLDPTSIFHSDRSSIGILESIFGSASVVEVKPTSTAMTERDSTPTSTFVRRTDLQTVSIDSSNLNNLGSGLDTGNNATPTTHSSMTSPTTIASAGVAPISPPATVLEQNCDKMV